MVADTFKSHVRWSVKLYLANGWLHSAEMLMFSAFWFIFDCLVTSPFYFTFFYLPLTQRVLDLKEWPSRSVPVSMAASILNIQSMIAELKNNTHNITFGTYLSVVSVVCFVFACSNTHSVTQAADELLSHPLPPLSHPLLLTARAQRQVEWPLSCLLLSPLHPPSSPTASASYWKWRGNKTKSWGKPTFSFCWLPWHSTSVSPLYL